MTRCRGCGDAVTPSHPHYRCHRCGGHYKSLAHWNWHMLTEPSCRSWEHDPVQQLRQLFHHHNEVEPTLYSKGLPSGHYRPGVDSEGGRNG